MSLAAALVLLFPLSLQSAQPDHLVAIIKEMRRLSLAGDQAAVGRLAPAALEELAKPHPMAALGWNQVGAYFHLQGDYIEAERAYLRGMRLAGNGDSANDRALLLLNLATLYVETKQRPAHAEVLCRRGLKHAIDLYGPASPALANFLCILAGARQQQGDPQDARRFLQEAFDLAGKGGYLGRIRQGKILASFAIVSALEKQWIQANDLLLQSLAFTEPFLGTSHPELISTHLNLARVRLHLKQWTLAYVSVTKAREIAEARLRPGHPHMAEILETSASILRKTGRRREAREHDRRAKAIAKAQPKNPASEASIHIADLKQNR